MTYTSKPRLKFDIQSWRLCARCIIGKCNQCTGRMKVEGLGEHAYRKCECNHDISGDNI